MTAIKVKHWSDDMIEIRVKIK